MGTGEGVRTIRIEEEEKETSIPLPWCHVGTVAQNATAERAEKRKIEKTFKDSRA